MNRCEDCGQRIWWVRMTPSGKAMMIDPDQNDAGNVVASGNPGRRLIRGRIVAPGVPIGDAEDRYMPHVATCPAKARQNGGGTRPAPAPAVPLTLFDQIERHQS